MAAATAVWRGCSAMSTQIRVINLSRNFGKEASLTAGLDHGHGDAMVIMDIDLQDPPDLLPQFLEKWHEGYDVVYGVRSRRSADMFAKRATAGIFYWLFNPDSAVENGYGGG